MLRSRADKPAIFISATAGVGVEVEGEGEGEGEGLLENGLLCACLFCLVSKSASSTKSTRQGLDY